MQPIAIILIFMLWLAVFGSLYFFATQGLYTFRIRERLFVDEEQGEVRQSNRFGLGLFLKQWFLKAGYESNVSIWIFFVALFVLSVLGFLMGYIFAISSLRDQMVLGLSSFPGNFGEIFVPLIELVPFTIFIVMAFLPIAYVRLKQRNRLEEIEQDLPVILEFLVTLSEAGLSFDESLRRVLEVYDAKRTLPQALNKFQKELISGQSRIRSYIRLRERIQETSVRQFISALMQSEQTGGRIGQILRYQANDSLSRRRLKAMETASSLTVKMLVPMVICFLPGIMIALMGPTIYTIIRLLDSVIMKG